MNFNLFFPPWVWNTEFWLTAPVCKGKGQAILDQWDVWIFLSRAHAHGSACRSPRVEHGGVEAGECHLRLETKATRVLVVSSDVRPGYCYTALTNGRCSNQLPQSITKMQCCCDAGRCWSPGVTVAPEMCPVRSTGKSPSVSSVAYPNTALPGPW